MLILTGRFVAKKERRSELLQLCHGMYAPSRAEDGCVSYGLWEDSDGSGNFMFFEEWTSRESLDKHFQTPHFARFMAAFPSLIQGEPVMKIYDTPGPRLVSEEHASAKDEEAIGSRR